MAGMTLNASGASCVKEAPLNLRSDIGHEAGTACRAPAL